MRDDQCTSDRPIPTPHSFRNGFQMLQNTIIRGGVEGGKLHGREHAGTMEQPTAGSSGYRSTTKTEEGAKGGEADRRCQDGTPIRRSKMQG